MLNFVLFLLVLMVVVSLITALVIEAVKKIVSEDSLKKAFKTLEIFSLVFTFIVATITYLCFLLFAMPQIDLLKVVVAGILFVFACGCGSQVGYDKVIKEMLINSFFYIFFNLYKITFQNIAIKPTINQHFLNFL